MEVRTQLALLRRFLPAILLLTLGATAHAQGITGEDIAAQRTAVTADAKLSEEIRAQLLTQLDEAEAQLQFAADFRAQTGEFKVLMEGAEQKALGFEQQLQDAQSSDEEVGEEELATDASVEEIETKVTLLSAEYQAMLERRRQLRSEIDGLPTRRAEIKQRLVELQSQGEPPALDLTSSDPEQRVAGLLATARHQAALAEQESLENEILSETDRARINGAERAWLGYAVEQAEARLATLNDALEQARSSVTEQQLETTARLQERLRTGDPRLQSFADGNRQLAEQLGRVTADLDAARREGLYIQTSLQNIEQDSELMNKRLEVAGRKEVLGRVMITRMDSLPDTAEIRRDIARRDELIASTSLAQIDMEEELRAINNRHDYLATRVPGTEDWDERSRELVFSLVNQREELLENTMKSQASLLRRLVDNNEDAGKLVAATDSFHRFLLGNLLWVRNFSFMDVGTMTAQLAVLLSPVQWSQLPGQLRSGYSKQAWSAILLLIFLLSLILRWRLRPVYDELMGRPVLLSGATLWQMVAGLALSVLLVLPWPLLLFILGYSLEAADPATEFNDALAPALMFTARILFALLFTRIIASRMGVGRRFLKWDSRILDSLRQELNWAGPLICLAFLVDVFAFNLDVVASGGPLGALATATIAVASIVLALRLQGQENIAEAALPRLMLRLVAFIGITVVGMQLLGLLFAAEIYLMALGRSVATLLTIKLLGDVIERWLMILRARLERQAREEKSSVDEDEEADEETRDLVDVVSLSEAHSKLLNMVRFVAAAVALFVIWAPSLPALNLLDTITLWHVADSTDPGGAYRAISLFDLVLSVVILVITGLVAKHLPSLSEVFMREWFNMSPGARYASSILMQYLVIAIGGSMFLATVGWEWGKVQWLVAALGVGIGFGLQEIVANFISGIIILFERPVRVGDIITAGGAEGTVRKINPRATIIETFDRKEHLIPNKELITGQVINWTLSDAAVRIVIPVGIAYGSDVRRALALLKEAAAEVQTVLDDPEPRASFEDFGDNALVLWLRCFASDDRVGTWTELRTLIDDKFREAGIVISFPQRDVHLDTLEPLQIEIRRTDPAPG